MDYGKWLVADVIPVMPGDFGMDRWTQAMIDISAFYKQGNFYWTSKPCIMRLDLASQRTFWDLLVGGILWSFRVWLGRIRRAYVLHEL
jgi:hypothetical protein